MQITDADYGCGLQIPTTDGEYGCGLRTQNTDADYGCGLQMRTTDAGYECGLRMWIMDADYGCGLPSLVPSKMAEDGRWDFAIPSVFGEDVTKRMDAVCGLDIVCALQAGRGWAMLTLLFPLYSVRMKRCGGPSLVPSRLAKDGR